MDVPLDFLIDEFAAIAGRQTVDLAIARATIRAAAASSSPAVPANGHQPGPVPAYGPAGDGGEDFHR